MEMEINKMISVLVSLCALMSTTQSLDRSRVYMESSCGSSHSVTTSFQLDSSTGLTYLNQQDCTYTVTAPSGYFVVAIITRFELEGQLTGACVDYLDAFDGADKTATKLNTDPICGSGSSVPGNLTASGQDMTLHFVTDNNGAYQGFSINFVAATNSPCSSSKYLCNTSICIATSLECDTYNQCGDSSDEEGCPESSGSGSINIVAIVLGVMLAGAVLGIIVAYIAIKAHKKNLWKKFLNMHLDDDDGIIEPGPSYPVTHQYYKGLRGHPQIHINYATTADDDKTKEANLGKAQLDVAMSDIPSVSSVKI